MAAFNQHRANLFDWAMQGGLTVARKASTVAEQQRRLEELRSNPAGKHLREYDLLHSSLSVKYKQSMLKSKFAEDLAHKYCSAAETSKLLERASPRRDFLSPPETSASKTGLPSSE